MGTIVVLILGGILLYVLLSGTWRAGKRRPAKAHRQPIRRTSGSRVAPRLEFSVELLNRDGSRIGGERPRHRPPVELAQEGDRCWIPPDKEVTIAGSAIRGGMVYVGEDLEPIGGWHEREPALIDPTLPVARRSPSHEGDGMSYWPSYSEIPPECRAAYLEWLASGRSDPDAYIGYVFLFFYGLERRLLFDLRHLPEPGQEAQRLLSEVERLLSLYSGNRSFRSYGRSLLETARALWMDGQAYDRSPSFEPGRREMPIDVRLAVAQLITEGRPIPGHWALAWVVGHPETRLRTPARRCAKEFRTLFLRRFADKFGAGLSLRPNKRRLRISHVPASASFGSPVEVSFDDLPEIAGLSKPVGTLRELAETAASELESYSRFVGRDPQQADSLQALALLPRELAETRQGPEVERLRTWIDSKLGSDECVVANASELMEHWECARTDRIRKSELGSFARLLDSLGCGIEPDPRYGGGAIAVDQNIALFRLRGEQPSAVSPGYHAATLLLHLAAAVAASDGTVSQQEERHLEGHLERSMHLTGAEVHRLRAHLHWLLASQPNFRGLKRRIEEIDERGRHQLAHFAVMIAGADGVIDPEEIKTLGKIYRMLGLDPDQAYADIHSLRTESSWGPADQPVMVRPSEAVDSGHSIPSRREPPAASTSGFRLDMDRVERTLAETAVVSSVLAGVFVEDDAPALSSAEGSEAPTVRAGLDAPHARLLQALAGSVELSRQAFEEMAERVNLLPDGAFETLNEAAFERMDAPVLEGDDPIEVDLEILGELMQ